MAVVETRQSTLSAQDGKGNDADTGVAGSSPATLDDIMIAMDVVDTVRHRDDLVQRELNDVGREAELIARLKKIYKDQGIDVPEHVLMEGVKALKESRFTYTPPGQGWQRRFLTLWATRRRWSKAATAGLAVVALGWGYFHFAVARPARLAEETSRVEISQTMPAAIRKAFADITNATSDPAARRQADQILSDGERAIRDKDRTAMQASATALRALLDDVNREYTLRIISRPGQTSGVWRRPPQGGQARNYYLIVEAQDADGRIVQLRIRNEENGETETVGKFGVRVPQTTFDAVAADKRDDGIIQRNIFAHKKRGKLTLDYAMPFEGGMITRW